MELRELFQFPFEQPFLDIFEFSIKIVLSSLSFMYLTFLFSTIIQMCLARQNDIFLRHGFGWLEKQEI